MRSTPLLPALLLLGLTAAPLMAAPSEVPVDTGRADDREAAELEEAPSWGFEASIGIDYCTKQLTYGLIDNPHPILTPAVELAFGHEDWFTLAIGVEAIFDMTNYGAKEGGYNDRRYKYQELAPGITLSRTWKTADAIGSDLETALNYTYEYHPRTCKKPAEEFENPDTQWLNFEISAPDFWLVPTLAIEYQLARQGTEGYADGKGAIYATFDVSHTFDIGAPLGLDEETLTLTPIVGFGMGNKARNECDFGDWYEENEKSADPFLLRDGYARLELTYAPIEGLEITPYIGCHQQLDSSVRDAVGSDDFVGYVGLSLSYTF